MEGMAGYTLPTPRTAPTISSQARRAPLTSSEMFGNMDIADVVARTIPDMAVVQPRRAIIDPPVVGTSKNWTSKTISKPTASSRTSTRRIPKAPVQPSATGSKVTILKKGKSVTITKILKTNCA